MNDLHAIGWYSARIAPHLPKEAFKTAPVRLWGGLAYLVLTVGSIAAIGVFDLPLLGNLGLAFLVGNGMAGLGFLGHEILHGSIVKTPWLRDFLGGIAFAQFLLGPKLWRKWHNMEHHAHTQVADVDPDAWATMEELYKRPLLRWVYKLPPWVRSLANFTSFTFFFSVHSQLMFREFYGQFRRRERMAVVLQLIAPATLWLALLIFMGPAKWVFAYVLPLMMANFLVISYISTNHQLNPITPVNDPLANSLTVTVPRWVDVLHFNFSYHTEHHLFPGMSPRWGPQIKAEAKRQWPDRYHEMPMTTAMATLWRTPRIYHEQTELVDPHRALSFGTLGHGLNPAKVQTRPVTLAAPPDQADTESALSLGRLRAQQD